MFVLITPKVLKSRFAVAKRQMQPESSKCDTVRAHGLEASKVSF